MATSKMADGVGSKWIEELHREVGVNGTYALNSTKPTASKSIMFQLTSALRSNSAVVGVKQLQVFVRHGQTYSRRGYRELPVVSVQKLKGKTLLSGTEVFEEDLAEINSREILFQNQVKSLTARGFLRSQKGYEPPPNAQERLTTLAKSVAPSLNKMKSDAMMKYRFRDSRLKYDLLSKAFEEFQHSVPNSMLYMIETIGDLNEFYNTPVKMTTPYDDLVRNKDLPQNVHIQKDAVRFHPETDTLFGGVSAFPKSSTIVTGLRAKRKYKGFSAKRTWP